MANKRSVATEDLRTYASAPVLRAASLKSGSLCAVRNTTFDEQPDSRSRSTASRPLSLGIEMSVTMTSGCSFMAASTRDSPLSTHFTTSTSRFNRLWTNASRPGWSSANNTRIFCNLATANPRGAGAKFKRSEAKYETTIWPGQGAWTRRYAGHEAQSIVKSNVCNFEQADVLRVPGSAQGVVA
jgi:hypothetical protein